MNRVVYHDEEVAYDEPWLNPIGKLGIAIIADEIALATDVAPFMRALRLSAQRRNRILAGEILAALIRAADSGRDFGGVVISGSHITELDLSVHDVDNFTVRDSIIEELNIAGVHPRSVRIDNCEIGLILGIADERGRPPWISGGSIQRYEKVTTVAGIRRATLSEEQRILVAVIKKTFFQPGTGRKEEALTRGFGQSRAKKTAEKVLKLLLDEGVLGRFKGEEGWVYTPQREYTRRMQAIMAQLTLSADPIWKKITRE